jgi:type VI protein secretion system component VasF
MYMRGCGREYGREIVVEIGNVANMRAKGINQMSTRRAVRPDAMVYRQTRRMGRRKRRIILPAVIVGGVLLVVVLVYFWIRHRH